MEEKIDTLYLIKIKNFSAKDTVKIMRKQATYGENIFKKYLLKNCYLKYIRNSSGYTIKKKSNQKWTKDLNKNLTEDDIQMANKHKITHYTQSVSCQLKQ